MIALARLARRAKVTFTLAAGLVATVAHADAAIDWNVRAGEIVTAAGLGTPPANRVMAISHTAAYEAANAIARRYAGTTPCADAPSNASIETAIAAAHRTVLTQLLPAQKAATDAAYLASLASVDDPRARDAGIAVGTRCAEALLAARANDGALGPDRYRPVTTPGVYVPTTNPVVPHWPDRKPWLMTSAAQFRPAPPPALASERWTRDYNEVKALGGRRSAQRTPAQTEVARFWEATLPPIYHGLVRSVAALPGRDLVRNARLFAAATQATDDALIAVFDAKYHYRFWRPVTAIRNGDQDGNDQTERDAEWLPLIDTPMHPEYPCAHCIQAAAVAAVLEAEIGNQPVTLTTASVTANGAARTWTRIDALVAEVADARVWAGVHYRTSAEVGAAMGRQIGALAVARFLGL